MLANLSNAARRQLLLKTENDCYFRETADPYGKAVFFIDIILQLLLIQQFYDVAFFPCDREKKKEERNSLLDFYADYRIFQH